jgi:hypothetical protein
MEYVKLALFVVIASFPLLIEAIRYYWRGK